MTTTIEPGHFHTVGGAEGLALALSPAMLMQSCKLDEPEAWQTDFLDARRPRELLNCCRGSGKSTTTAVAALHEVLFCGPDALVLIICPSERQSKLMLRTVKTLYRRIGGVVEADADTATRLEFPTGRIESLPGSSEKTIRAYQGVTLLIWDEMSRLDDEIIDASTPMVSEEGRIIGLSTPAGMRGAFYRLFTGAYPLWHRVRITGVESGRISARKLEEERERMLPNVFATEYMCEFEDSANVLFPTALIDAALDDDLEPYEPERMRFV